MKLSLIIAPLIAAKVSHDVIMETVLAFEAQQTDALEKRREADRNRQNRKRNGDVTLSHVTRPPSRSHAGVEDNLSKKDITGKKDKKDTAPAALSDLEAFRAEVSQLLDAERVEAIVKHRRAKKGQLTAHAARLFIADAKAAGLSLPDAVDTCISRNWITVKADWLNKPQATAPPKKTTLATMWHEEARNHGILNDPPSQTTRHLDASLPRGQDQGTGLARRIASA
jgi:hypothetical protein